MKMLHLLCAFILRRISAVCMREIAMGSWKEVVNSSREITVTYWLMSHFLWTVLVITCNLILSNSVSFRFWRALTRGHNTLDYWVFGLSPLSCILNWICFLPQVRGWEAYLCTMLSSLERANRSVTSVVDVTRTYSEWLWRLSYLRSLYCSCVGTIDPE
jgi:hypothetical protein